MLTFACGLLLLALPQEVDLLQAVLRCEVRGTSAFTPGRVRAAIAADGVVIRRLREGAGIDDLGAAVRHRVREGYLYAGHGEVEVDTESHGGVLTITVREGSARTCGAVVVEGNGQVPGADIEAALRELEEADRWAAGVAAKLDRRTRALYATTVQTCYLRVGRHGARCSVDWTPDGTTAELRVTVADEGQEIRVGRLEITGERPEDLDEVMRRVTFQEDALYTDDWARDLRARIEALGRYSRVQLPRPEDARGGRLDPFRVQVEVVAFAPAIAATPWDDLAQLQRGLSWVQTAMLRGHAMRVELTSGDDQQFEILGHHLSFARGIFHLAADGVALGWDDVRWDGRPLGSPRVVVSGDEVMLALRQGHHGWATVDSRLPVEIAMHTAVVDDHMELQHSLNFNAKKAGLAIRVHPATATSLLVLDDLCWRRDGGTLVAEQRADGTELLRVAADGSMRGRVVGDFEGGRLVGSLVEGGIGSVMATLEPTAGTPRPALDELAAVVAECTAALLASAPEVAQQAAALANATARFTVDRAGAGGAPATKRAFHIPPAPAQDADSLAMVTAMRVASLGTTFAGDGWPRVTLEALPSLILGGTHRRAAAGRLRALAAETGPLARAVMAAEMRLAGFAGPASHMRESALLVCEFPAFWRDVLQVADALSLRDQLRQLGSFWRKQPELQPLFDDLRGEDVDDAALRLGFETLWDAGLGRVVRDLIRRLD